MFCWKKRIILILTSLILQQIGSIEPENKLWIVRIDGGLDAANSIAEQNGFENKGEINEFKNTYLFVRQQEGKRRKREVSYDIDILKSDHRVDWVENLTPLKRKTRDEKLTNQSNNEHYKKQWHFRKDQENRLVFENMKVKEAWKLGFTGKGVVVSVVDDGIDRMHTDLKLNYDPYASFDFIDNDEDPTPKNKSHGTLCAGVIAMAAKNTKCGVGAAFNAKIGGIRMMQENLNDIIEAKSLIFNLSHIDIYSSSWGPVDDGRTVEGPLILTKEALERGVTEGRDGKGAIYIWASGNGGYFGDNCNCDGYANSINTLTIGSAHKFGQVPYYAEKCASIMAVTYSSEDENRIVTTNVNNNCFNNFGGTSASAALAAGIIALTLEAKDVQHLIVNTSDFKPLNGTDWKRNGAGLMYNSQFGFGLIDAEAMVKAALSWVNVPPKTNCYTPIRKSFQQHIPIGKSVIVDFDSNGCKGSLNEINSLEHVQVFLSISYFWRGDLEISLTSPSGTNSLILSQRPLDTSSKGFVNWPFSTVHFWGENPRGIWRLNITTIDFNQERLKSVECSNNFNCKILEVFAQHYSGWISKAELLFHGTKNIPIHLKK